IAGACNQAAFFLRQPSAGLVDTDQHRLETVAVQCIQHITGREDGNLVLGRLAAEEDADADFWVHGAGSEGRARRDYLAWQGIACGPIRQQPRPDPHPDWSARLPSSTLG